MTVRGGQTFSKAISLLRLLTDATNGSTFTELLVASGQPKATLHRLIQTMIEERLIRYDIEDRRYRLGYGFLEIAGIAWSRLDVRVAAGDSLSELSRACGESVFLSILDGSETIVVDSMDSRRRGVSGLPPVGQRAPVYCTAAGKVLLAQAEAEASAKILDGLTLNHVGPNTVGSRNELAAQLALARRNGFAIDDEEQASGIRSVAAPVFNQHDRAIGAVSIAASLAATTPRRIAELARMVTATAAQITLHAGGRHTPTPVPAAVGFVLDLAGGEPSMLPEGDVPC